jgi:hypothetical protein
MMCVHEQQQGDPLRQLDLKTWPMTSTYLTYQRLTRDLSKSLAQTASKPDVAREREYYEANIGKVKSVDDFLNNPRLFAYAMKAYGLEDMTFAKAFMRKVLESDLNDSKSFARQLVDQRYLAFASAFSFTTDGSAESNLPYVQNDFQENDTTGLYSQHRVNQGAAAATEAQYYQSRMASVTSVDDLLADPRLFNYALTAVGLDPSIASTTTIRKVLTSDLSDPASYANTLGDTRYRTLTSLFSFQADGSVASGSSAQSAAQVNDTVYRYYGSSGTDASPAAAAFNTDYYNSTIGSVTSVDDLLNNDRLYRYALTAFGLDPDIQSKATIRQVLTSDLSDPNSFANKQANGSYKLLAQSFNFATDGSVNSGEAAQSTDEVHSTTDLYLTHYGDKAASADSVATSFYKNRINLLSSVDDLIGNDQLYTYVLNAYGFDPNVESKATIKQVLTSDVSNPTSFANLQRDPRYAQMAADFNFGADGSVLRPRKAQQDQEELGTIRLYNTRIGSTDAERQAAADESTYYHNTITQVQSVDQLLGDQRLVTYLRKAYDLGSDISDGELRTALTSDPMDENSFVDKQSDTKLRDLAAAFNFDAKGGVGRVSDEQAQIKSSILDTTDLNTRQVMETDAGADSPGARLALYFQRKAPSINSAFDILADKAIFEVVRTALSLPDSMSQADIQRQADILISRINLDDFRDPDKLEKFISRFAALYDMNNGTADTPSAASIILSGQTGSIGTDQTLLGKMQDLIRSQF